MTTIAQRRAAAMRSVYAVALASMGEVAAFLELERMLLAAIDALEGSAIAPRLHAAYAAFMKDTP